MQEAFVLLSVAFMLWVVFCQPAGVRAAQHPPKRRPKPVHLPPPPPPKR